MQYRVVFDVTKTGFGDWPWQGFGIGALFILWSLLALSCPNFLARQGLTRKPIPRLGAIAVLIFSTFWTLTVVLKVTSDHRRLVSALENGSCDVVEGEVLHFDPMPYTGHAEESFYVGRMRFHYSDYIVTPGFHNTASHGGPIRDGEQVRIHYLGNDIARLEIAGD